MNKNLTVLDQREVLGKDFTMYGTKEEPLFLAKDVAEWIGHSKPRDMVLSVDEDEKVKMPFKMATSRSTQEQWFLTEDGLYEVLMQSRKPIAKQFKKQVKAILKQIRMTGGYIPVKEEDTEKEILAKALMIMQNTLAKKDELVAMKEAQLQEQKPKVEYFDNVLDSSRLVTVTQIANDLGITATELNKILKAEGIQNKQYGNWKISKKYMWLIEEGYANYAIYNKNSKVPQLLKWTEKGRKFIIDLVKYAK